MKKRRSVRDPAAEFHQYYSELYGDRWEGLASALRNDPAYHEVSAPLVRPYYLDGGSRIAASTLPLEPEDNILDMCAAPGGKTLVLASRMPEGCRITANEKSRERRAKLYRVLEEHLPEELYQRITVTGYDASRWGLYEQERFDKILLDVPCSSERHIVNSPSHLAQWSPARTKHLSIQAYALLASAFQTIRRGGYILYSTCALSPRENDDVISKLVKRKGEETEVIIPDVTEAEKTARGNIILPDTSGGMGPLYFSLVRKTYPGESETESPGSDSISR